MKTIAVVCEKGGTGKSVIAYELYRNFCSDDIATSLYSLDGQYSDSARFEKADNPSIAIVDTPGVIADNLKDIIEGADLIVVPTRPTPNDIEPFTRTVSIVHKLTDAPVIIAVNGFNRFRMASSFIEWLSQKHWAKEVVTIPQSEAIVQAQAEHKSVVEIDKHSKAAQAVKLLYTVTQRLL